MLKQFALNGLAIVGVLASVCAHADQGSGGYLGAGGGKATVKYDTGYDESDTGFKVFGGYDFNKYFGAELAYVDGGDRKEEAVETPPAVIGPPITVSSKVAFTAVNFSLVGRLPLSDLFAVFGKIGYASYELKNEYSGGYFTHGYVDKTRDEDISYGGGVAVSFGKFDLRAEYEAMELDAGDFHFVSLSSVYRF